MPSGCLGESVRLPWPDLGGWGGSLDFLSLSAPPWAPQPSLGSHPPTRPEASSFLAPSALEVPHWPVHPAPLHALQGPAGLEAKFQNSPSIHHQTPAHRQQSPLATAPTTTPTTAPTTAPSVSLKRAGLLTYLWLLGEAAGDWKKGGCGGSKQGAPGGGGTRHHPESLLPRPEGRPRTPQAPSLPEALSRAQHSESSAVCWLSKQCVQLRDPATRPRCAVRGWSETQAHSFPLLSSGSWKHPCLRVPLLRSLAPLHPQPASPRPWQ